MRPKSRTVQSSQYNYHMTLIVCKSDTPCISNPIKIDNSPTGCRGHFPINAMEVTPILCTSTLILHCTMSSRTKTLGTQHDRSPATLLRKSSRRLRGRGNLFLIILQKVHVSPGLFINRPRKFWLYATPPATTYSPLRNTSMSKCLTICPLVSKFCGPRFDRV